MIPMNDLSIQYRKLKSEINNSIDRVLEHGKYIMGPEVLELERKLAEYVGVDYAVTCSSGTDALLLPLLAWEIGKGDAVFTTPFTFIATSEVVSLLGATPVFVDINPETYNIDPELLEQAIIRIIEEDGLKPRVVIPVDLFGLPADYEKIEAIAAKYNIRVLEDAAQGFGGRYKGRKAGSFGDAASTSFFPAKPLGCYGDGGAIFTRDSLLYEAIKSIRVHGQGIDKYDNIRIGINGRLDTIQAAILLAKLSIFDSEIDLRNEVANKYTAGLKELIKTPQVPEEYSSAWAQYSVLTKDYEVRESLMREINDKGIQTAIYYRKPLHLQAANRKLGYKKGDFPISEDISNRILSLPMHPYLENETIAEIINLFVDNIKG
ncbi:MAG: aminotransferase DegT [Firmicutes bacterium HGW-Firmicutes-1]|nr:MAG: aminotransferase DegT [Firmicutes bacterium HGW-Firmicutes-1]